MLKKILFRIKIWQHDKKFRKSNRQSHITFVSQNCVGGVLYRMLGIPFSSPTINMFIEDENFVKLAENPAHYFSTDAEPYEECHREEGETPLEYPVIKVDDILLCCQHYKNCGEAVEAWNRRRKRVNLDNIFVISCSWDLHERPDLIKRVAECKYPKVIFTLDEYEYDSCVRLDGTKWTRDDNGKVKPALTSYDGNTAKRHFEDVFDFVEWINR